jgi:hypothetical protein
MANANGLGVLIATLAVAILLFLICRAIVLWYWRVNEGIALLESIDEKLGRIAENSGQAERLRNGMIV